jgi:hypothetical protein
MGRTCQKKNKIKRWIIEIGQLAANGGIVVRQRPGEDAYIRIRFHDSF